MTEDRVLLADTAAKVFRDLPADFAQSRERIAEAGFALLLVPESAGGFGGGWQDANVVLRAAGAAAIDFPLAEAIIANSLLDGAADLASICVQTDGTISGDRFTGELRAVPFGAECERIVAQTGARTVGLRKADVVVARDYRNIAGERRADLTFDAAPVQSASTVNALDLLRLGALARTCQIAGALETALAMTIEHAKTREQFGRAIGNFQAIQQQLAVFATETAAVGAAASSACRAADRGDASFQIASAKLRANRAVDIATSAAHQIHGAIGITQEHALHRYTQRLWAWKSEYGNDRFWATKLGGEIAACGADNFWPALTMPQ
jgi:acyl-CoA dehydrogenase